MRPRIIGRVLGIGVRVVGRAAGHHLAVRPRPAASTQVLQATRVAGSLVQSFMDRNRVASQAPARAALQPRQSTGQAASPVNRGVGGFIRPFRRVGGILWLEITGAFYLIFVPVFVWRGAWPARASYLHGPDHWRFLVFTCLSLVFLYLGVSSFWRASRK